MRISKIISKDEFNASQRDKSSSEILKDIYGNRTGGFYEFDLAEATDESDLNFSFLKRNANHYV